MWKLVPCGNAESTILAFVPERQEDGIVNENIDVGERKTGAVRGYGKKIVESNRFVRWVMIFQPQQTQYGWQIQLPR